MIVLDRMTPAHQDRIRLQYYLKLAFEVRQGRKLTSARQRLLSALDAVLEREDEIEQEWSRS